jgi:hypothetical protein
MIETRFKHVFRFNSPQTCNRTKVTVLWDVGPSSLVKVCNVFSVNTQLNNHPIFYYRYDTATTTTTCFGPIQPSSGSVNLKQELIQYHAYS